MKRVQAAVPRPALATMAAVVVALSLVGLAAVAPASAQATRSCGWTFRLAGDQVNAAYPDQAAQYWVARVAIPPGGYVEAAGRYPHSRYISFITYTGASQAIDGLADINIAPDPGSSNPFLTGADRTATRRSYHAFVRSGAPPASGRESNSVYTDNGQGGTNGKSSQGGTVLIYRVYEADRGLDIAGGVGLPSLTVVGPAGQRAVLPACTDTSLPDAGVTQAIAASGFGAQPDTVQSGLGGRNPPVWTRYTNAANSVSTGVLGNQTTGAAYPPVAQGTNNLPTGGFFENVNNAYVFSFYAANFGDVLLLRARAPVTPRTYDGETVMQPGQLRYFSFCTNTAASNYLACRNDDAIPVDSSGNYTLAISSAANRPSNAREGCGIAWLPAGPTPQTPLILRNMLPASSFAEAVQNAKQGNEQQTMGAYYPGGTYYHRTGDVEALGCHPPSRPTEAQLDRDSDLIGLPSSQRCLRRARWSFRLHASRGQRIVSATVFIDRHRVKRRHGRRLRHIVVRLPIRRTFALKIVTRSNTGARHVSVRTYRACTKTRPQNRVRRRRGGRLRSRTEPHR